MEYSFCNDTIRWQMAKIYRRHISSRHFADINVLFIFIQKVGHGGSVQFYSLMPFDGKCQNL